MIKTLRMFSTGAHMHRAGKSVGEVLGKVDALKENKKFLEALRELRKIEGKFPDYVKIILRYQGEIKYALLEEQGKLPSMPKIGR